MEPEERNRPPWHQDLHIKKLEELVDKIDTRLKNIEKELHPDNGLNRVETIRVYRGLSALVVKLKGIGSK